MTRETTSEPVYWYAEILTRHGQKTRGSGGQIREGLWYRAGEREASGDGMVTQSGFVSAKVCKEHELEAASRQQCIVGCYGPRQPRARDQECGAPS
jgi:hypothetical protein